MKEIILVLDNIRSTHNVGSILRSAEGFGVKKVIFSGCTPKYNDTNLLPHLREKQNKAIEKTALGAEKMLELNYPTDINKTLDAAKLDAYQIIGLENNIKDDRLISIRSNDLRQKLKEKIILILGEEVNGINKNLYDYVDLFLEIPMKGHKESFNVSVATAIALFALAD